MQRKAAFLREQAARSIRLAESVREPAQCNRPALVVDPPPYTTHAADIQPYSDQ